MNMAVLVSGGVDSSVALSLLRKQGQHKLTAFYLKIWLEDDLQFLGECPWEDDLRYAREVCAAWDVPLEVVSLQTAYWDRVVHHTIAELKKGHTPSPDILCNQRVKFGAFLDLVGQDFDLVASGHYARVQEDGDSYRLLRGVDPVKDQTYFLSQLSQQQLARCRFPVGHYQKSEVRALAQDFVLANRDRKDSQGICFLGKIKYNDFVKAHLGEKPGEIINRETNQVVGEHKGFWFHTIGQRKGLGMSGGPWYVVGKDIEKNIVYVATSQTKEAQMPLSFHIREVNWINDAPQDTETLAVKIRHGARTTECQVFQAGNGLYRIDLTKPDGGIAAGQYAVLYRGEECLGSGVISAS
ncbi:MAG: tRNA 2-thiouridine(34) synthase MnmA [Oligoflexus sp.]